MLNVSFFFDGACTEFWSTFFFTSTFNFYHLIIITLFTPYILSPKPKKQTRIFAFFSNKPQVQLMHSFIKIIFRYTFTMALYIDYVKSSLIETNNF